MDVATRVRPGSALSGKGSSSRAPDRGSGTVSTGRLLVLALIMAAVAISAVGVVAFMLYRHHLEDERARLVEIVKSRAALIEAVARFDKAHSVDAVEGGAFAATLNQVREAHERFQGFGQTGEVALARRAGDQIEFLLRHRHGGHGDPAPVPFSSGLAEPMRRALSGRSGDMRGMDYRGAEVLAAYEPIPVLGVGIVAKIDLAEVRAQFIRAGQWALLATTLLIAVGLVIFRRVGNPLVKALLARTHDLEEQIAERARVEGVLSGELRVRAAMVELSQALNRPDQEIDAIAEIVKHHATALTPARTATSASSTQTPAISWPTPSPP
jgi:hypothetical protein